MSKNKLERFKENEALPNVFQPLYETLTGDGFTLRGSWRNDFFKNNNPIVVEVGCGKGEYTVGLAEKYPGKNFIGMDIKGARLWKGATTAIEKNLHNVAFIRTRVDFIEYCFGNNEVDEIWITFPDPQPQKSREKKRLTSPRFLNRYNKKLKPGGTIHLKTDNRYFFDYTLEVIDENELPLLAHTTNLYSSTSEFPEAAAIQTHYESIFLKQQVPICYLKFQLTGKTLDEGKSRAIEEVAYHALGREKHKM